MSHLPLNAMFKNVIVPQTTLEIILNLNILLCCIVHSIYGALFLLGHKSIMGKFEQIIFYFENGFSMTSNRDLTWDSRLMYTCIIA